MCGSRVAAMARDESCRVCWTAWARSQDKLSAIAWRIPAGGALSERHRVAQPVPARIRRDGGEAAVTRASVDGGQFARCAPEPSIDGRHPVAAFNLTITSKLIGTPWMPDLAGHVVMIEEVSEHLYAIDRLMLHVTSNEAMRRIAGFRMGRMSDIPENDPPFGQAPEEIVRHWCAVSGIPFLGLADIGHDTANKVVPFGR